MKGVHMKIDEKDFRPPNGFFVDGIQFETEEQKIVYDFLKRYLTSLNIPININIKDNKAYFSTASDSYPCLCVFPYENESLHFRFSKDLNKPIDPNNFFIVYVPNSESLEYIKIALKVLFISKNPTNFKKVQYNIAENRKDIVPAKSYVKEEPKAPSSNTHSIEPQRMGVSRRKNKETDKIINKFFK